MRDGLPLYLSFLSNLKEYVEERVRDEKLKRELKYHIDKLASGLMVMEYES